MSEIFNKPYCLAFYDVYDRLLENFNLHIPFLYFLKKEFCKESKRENLHKAVLRILIKFLRLRRVEPPLDIRQIKKMQSFYSDALNKCYLEKFSHDFPDDPNIQNEILFKSDQICFSIFNPIENFIDQAKPEEKQNFFIFVFIREFSKFIYYNKLEPVEYFRRFLLEYPFEAEDCQCTENAEWIEKHQSFFDLVKDNSCSGQELKVTRNWFKSQLEIVDVKSLSEKHKSEFFKEMFIAFGNISSPKSGGIEGFVVPLKKVFLLGRYYNIHVMPMKFIEWTGDNSPSQKTLADLAYFSLRNIKGGKPISPAILNQAAKEGKGCLAIESGKKARRIDMDTLKTQEPYGEKPNPSMMFDQIAQCVIKNIPLSICGDITPKNFFSVLLKVLSVTGVKSMIHGIGFQNKIDEAVDQLNTLSNSTLQDLVLLLCNFAFALSPKTTLKPFMGVFTHYDYQVMFNLPNDAKKLISGLLSITIKKILLS